MKYNYPHTGNDKLMFQERFWSPAYVASNGGTVTGSLSFNNGAVFDGTAKYVDYLRKDHGFPAQWTLFAEVIKGIQTSQFTIFSRWGTTAATQQFCLSITAGGSLKLDVQWTDGTSTSLTDTVNGIDIGQKCQVAATYDGTTIRLFVNGVAGSTVAVASKRLRRTTTAFRVGATANTGSEYYFKGTITEIRQYGTVLSQSDLQNLGAEAIAYNGLLWSPALISGCILYGGNYLEARATRAAAPVPHDWDMELDNITQWAPQGATLVTKETANPSPAGGRWLRIEKVGSDYYAQQWSNVIIPGCQYNVSGWVKTGNGGIAGFLPPDPNLGSPLTWTRFSTDVLFSGNYFYPDVRSGSPSGGWTGWDDILIRNLSVTSYRPAYLAPSVAGTAWTQATPTLMPWAGSYGIQFDLDLLAWNAAASVSKCMSDGTGGTLFVAVRFTSLNVGNMIVSTMPGADATGVGVQLIYNNNNTVEIVIGNGSGVYAASATAAATAALNTTYVFAVRVVAGVGGVTVWQNGVKKLTTNLTSPSASNPVSSGCIGAPYASASSHTKGFISIPTIYNRALTDDEIVQVTNYMLSQVTP